MREQASGRSRVSRRITEHYSCFARRTVFTCGVVERGFAAEWAVGLWLAVDRSAASGALHLAPSTEFRALLRPLGPALLAQRVAALHQRQHVAGPQLKADGALRRVLELLPYLFAHK